MSIDIIKLADRIVHHRSSKISAVAIATLSFSPNIQLLNSIQESIEAVKSVWVEQFHHSD